MKMRKVYLARDETISDSQTKIIDLKGVDPISALEVIYEATNGSTSNTGHPLHKDISKVEVVDGSDVLYSLSMPQSEALDFFEMGKMPYMTLDESGGAVQKESTIIHFGRFIGDNLLYLDPARFSNPQLKLTHSLTISSTAGFATGTGKITVIAHVFEEKPPTSIGFLMAKELYSWTTAASGDETIDLPTDYPYRFLLIRAYESGTALTSNITKVKLTCDEDKFIPIDLYTDDLVSLNQEWFGFAAIENKLLRADAASPETFIGIIEEAVYYPLADLHVGHVESISADTVTLELLVLTTTPTIAKETTATAGNLYVKGIAPHNVLGIPFGDPQNPDSWFPATTFKTIKLKVTQGDAGAAASVVLQQLRKY